MSGLTRRAFLGLAAAAPVVAVLPELLWTPSRKIFLPPRAGWPVPGVLALDGGRIDWRFDDINRLYGQDQFGMLIAPGPARVWVTGVAPLAALRQPGDLLAVRLDGPNGRYRLDGTFMVRRYEILCPPGSGPMLARVELEAVADAAGNVARLSVFRVGHDMRPSRDPGAAGLCGIL